MTPEETKEQLENALQLISGLITRLQELHISIDTIGEKEFKEEEKKITASLRRFLADYEQLSSEFYRTADLGLDDSDL